MMGAALTLVQHLETPSERVDGFVDAIGRGRERRQEVEAVSDRANEEASLERLAVERETIARDVGARSSGAWVHEIARGDRAKAAGVPNRRVGRKARPGGAEPLREVLCMFEYGRLIEEREARGRHRARNRVCRVAMPVQKCARLLGASPKQIEERIGRAGQCQREDAAGQSFRQAQDVGRDTRVNASEEGAGSTEARHDLVEDQIDAVLVACPPEVVQEFRGPHSHSAGSLHERLRDEGCERRAVLRKVGGNRIACFFEGDLSDAARQFTSRVARNFEPLAAKKQRPEDRRQKVSELTDPNGAERVPMIRVPERPNLGALPLAAQELGLEGHLEGDLHGGRAVVGEEASGQGWWESRQEARHELERRLVGDSREEYMVERRCLTRERLDEARMAVAVHAGPPARNAVENAAISLENQIGSLGPDDRDRRGELVLFHLREWMPDMGDIHRNAVCPRSGKRRSHEPDDARSHTGPRGTR